MTGQVIHPNEKKIVYINPLPITDEIRLHIREDIVLNW